MRRKCNGAKQYTEATGLYVNTSGRGAFRVDEGIPVRGSGDIGRENAGISNEKGCEIHPRRKPKVSWVKVIFPG